MRLKFKNIVYFLLLFLFLGIPFAIKNIDSRLEMFPGVILPSGGAKYPLKDKFLMPIHEVYGLTSTGVEKKLDKTLFMYPIPKKNSEAIILANFGLNEYKTRNFTTSRLGLKFELDSKISKNDIAETKMWIRSKLRDQGCLDSLLIVKKEQYIIARDGSYNKDITILNDTIFNLY